MGIKEIETAIEKLSAREVSELTAWLIEYHQQIWERQIEEDLESGRLDKLLNEVEQEYRAGTATLL